MTLRTVDDSRYAPPQCGRICCSWSPRVSFQAPRGPAVAEREKGLVESRLERTIRVSMLLGRMDESSDRNPGLDVLGSRFL